MDWIKKRMMTRRLIRTKSVDEEIVDLDNRVNGE